MPGPCSGNNKPDSPNGKTKKDHASGKHQRRLANRRADFIRNNGGKQFGSKKG